MIDYGVNQIKTLEGIEAIRIRSGMYVGSVGPEGVAHITLEIISNAIDEYLNGHCSTCIIQVSTDNIVTIIDDGRGVPFGKAEDGSETLENIFTKLHTGAKFNLDGQVGYNTSGGLNGVGAKATNALSEFFVVTSRRDGLEARMEFHRGKRTAYTVNNIAPTLHGTKIEFKPDAEIFKEGIELDFNQLNSQIKELSYLSPGMKFEFFFKNKETIIYQSTEGIKEYLTDLTKSKEKLTSMFYTEQAEDRVGVKIAMVYTDSYSDSYKLYTNSIPNSAGTHLTGFRTALTQTINEIAREQKWLKEKEANITGEELKEGLTLILSFIMPDPVFSGQTKDVLSSSEGRTIVQRLAATTLRSWLKLNPKDAKAIVDKALLARLAREKAKKAKETVRKAEVKRRVMLPGTLADANSKSRKECEVFIVEGKSASGSAKEARDRNTQAIFPIRGKLLNVLKADLHKALQNKEINDMVTAFGLEIKDNKITIDEKKLRYGKIIITADADVDGSHIRVLFLTFIWKFAPELITKGYVYAAVPPLYKITQGTKIKYLKDDAALEQYRAQNPTAKFELSRFKGLGEQDPSELAETVMSKETRTLKQITMDDAVIAAQLFQDLMGDKVEPRKVFILENAAYANIDI